MDRPNAPVSDKLARNRLAKLYKAHALFVEGVVNADVAKILNQEWLNMPVFNVPSDVVVVIHSSPEGYVYSTVHLEKVADAVLHFVINHLSENKLDAVSKPQLAEFDAFAQREQSNMVALTLVTGHVIPLLVQKQDNIDGIYVLSTSIAVTPGIAGATPLFVTLAFTAILKTRVLMVNLTTPSWLYLMTMMSKSLIKQLENVPVRDKWELEFERTLTDLCVALPRIGIDCNVRYAMVVLNRLAVQRMEYDDAELPFMINMVLQAKMNVPVRGKLLGAEKTELGPLFVLGYSAYASSLKAVTVQELPNVVGPIEYTRPTQTTQDSETVFFAQLTQLMPPLEPQTQTTEPTLQEQQPTPMIEDMASCMMGHLGVPAEPLDIEISKLQEQIKSMRSTVENIEKEIAKKQEQIAKLTMQKVGPTIAVNVLPPLPPLPPTPVVLPPLPPTPVAVLPPLPPVDADDKAARVRKESPLDVTELPASVKKHRVLKRKVVPAVLPEPAKLPEPVVLPIISEPEPTVLPESLPELLTQLPEKNIEAELAFRSKHKNISSSTYNAIQNLFSERVLTSPKPAFAFYDGSLKRDQVDICSYVEQVYGIAWELLTTSVLAARQKAQEQK